jgi:broad specificity phosphatase PhoE
MQQRHIRHGGGETLAEAGARAAPALVAALHAAVSGSTVVAVSHGLALQAAVSRLAALGVW